MFHIPSCDVLALDNGFRSWPGLSSKTSLFKWPQRQSWKVLLDAVNNLQSRFLYLLQLYLIPVSVLTDAVFICQTVSSV